MLMDVTTAVSHYTRAGRGWAGLLP